MSIHQGDVGSADDCRRTVQEVIDHHGRLDILVNNAGITADHTIFKMTDEDWYKVLAAIEGRRVRQPDRGSGVRARRHAHVLPDQK